MRCAVSSRAGQILARGRLFVQPNEDGELSLNFQSDRGTLIQGGIVAENGDMTEAGQVLMRQFFEVWHMTDLTLTASSRM